MDQEQQPTATQPARRSNKNSADGATIASRVVWYLAGLVITFLALRIVLLLLAADEGNAFVHFVYAVSGFYAYPFEGIFGEPTYGQLYFDTSSAVAIVIYTLVAFGLCKAFTLTKRREQL